MRPLPKRSTQIVATAALLLAIAPAAGSAAETDPQEADASVRFDPRSAKGGDIPDRFVGFSIEWTLIDRYMGPNSRRGFANLMDNLGTGVLRIGGSSQDQVPFDANSPDTDRFITPHDLASIRATLDLTNRSDDETPDWPTVLGTAMAPRNATFPWRSPEHASAFARDGVAPHFSDDAGRRYMAGVALGNEPDLTYQGDLNRYLGEYPAYADAEGVNQLPRIAPNTSENIGTWQRFTTDPTFNTRWFFQWPQILDAVAPSVNDRPGTLGPFATDHFYPLARTCPTDPYRCPTIERLLAEERVDSFNYEVYTHAAEAARHGMRYRMDETNTAAGRGAQGVSDVAASGIWTLDTLFNAACPQPPDQPGANTDCKLGATGVNLHNSEVRAYFFPHEGNAYYNAVRYDPTPAAGTPTAAPSYYAMLLFSRLAQGTTGLRPVTVDSADPAGVRVKAWQVRAGQSERRLFMMNKGAAPVTVDVQAPESRVEVNRLTPYDDSGAGRGLDAPEMRIDGQAVAADGRFPGLDPAEIEVDGGRVPVTIASGEAVVVTLQGDAQLQYEKEVARAARPGARGATTPWAASRASSRSRRAPGSRPR